jgi:hypothetical protein
MEISTVQSIAGSVVFVVVVAVAYRLFRGDSIKEISAKIKAVFKKDSV